MRSATRTALLSDIHGNLVALDAVLADVERRDVDLTVCLGDVAASGPQPREVIEVLRRLRWPCVMGNTDESLVKNLPEKFSESMPDEERGTLERLDEWTREQLSGSERGYLSTFKPTISLRRRRSHSLLCYHGSPRSNLEGVFVGESDDDLARHFAGYKGDVFAGGHTHVQMLRRFGGSLIINPGSVGLPFEKVRSGGIVNPAHAEYAIVSSADGSLDVELLTVPYPLSALRKAVWDSGMPAPDSWLSDWR